MLIHFLPNSNGLSTELCNSGWKGNIRGIMGYMICPMFLLPKQPKHIILLWVLAHVFFVIPLCSRNLSGCNYVC